MTMTTFTVSTLCAVMTTVASFKTYPTALTFRPPFVVATPLFESTASTTTAEATIASSSREDDGDGASETITVDRPVVHWTVPGFKVGWRDENGDWFDEDGPREGPPLNYWRQKADERAREQDMALVDEILDSSSIPASLLATLESRNSVRFPALSRKLLGRWVPLREGGARRATRAADGDAVTAPCVVEVRRADGRRLAPKIVYGTFDARLTEGERLALQRTTGSRETRVVAVTATVDKSDPRSTFPEWGGLGFGSATYLSDYLLIMRRDDDNAADNDRDVWMRADDSHLPEESRSGGTVLEK